MHAQDDAIGSEGGRDRVDPIRQLRLDTVEVRRGNMFRSLEHSSDRTRDAVNRARDRDAGTRRGRQREAKGPQ